MRNLSSVNEAFQCKWSWHFTNEKALWKNVIAILALWKNVFSVFGRPLLLGGTSVLGGFDGSID